MLETFVSAHPPAPAFPLPRFARPPENAVSLVQHFQMEVPDGHIRNFSRLSEKAGCDEYARELTSLLAVFNCQYAFGEIRITSCTAGVLCGSHTLQHVPFAGQSADCVMQSLKHTARGFKDVLTQQGWKFHADDLSPHVPSA